MKARQLASEKDRLLTTIDAADLLRVSVSQLNKWRLTPNAGPDFVRFGRAVRYEPEAIRAFIAKHRDGRAA